MQIPSGMGNFVAKRWLWTGTLEVALRAEVCELLKEVGWGWVGVAPEGEFGLGFSSCLHMGDRKEGTNSCPLLSLGHGEPSYCMGIFMWFELRLNTSASAKLERVVDPLEFSICIFLLWKAKSK